jgi:hypothetical protein
MTQLLDVMDYSMLESFLAHTKDDAGRTALDVAAQAGQPGAVRELVRRGGSPLPHPHCSSALLHGLRLVHAGHADGEAVCRELMHGWTAKHTITALEPGNPTSAHPAVLGVFNAHAAVTVQPYLVVKSQRVRLLQLGVDYAAAAAPTLLSLLLDQPGCSAAGVKPHAALDGMPADLLGRLLGAGADANARDEKGVPLLHRAAEAGNLGAVQALLARGAAPGVTDKRGQTCMQYGVLQKVRRNMRVPETPRWACVRRRPSHPAPKPPASLLRAARRGSRNPGPPGPHTAPARLAVRGAARRGAAGDPAPAAGGGRPEEGPGRVAAPAAGCAAQRRHAAGPVRPAVQPLLYALGEF